MYKPEGPSRGNRRRTERIAGTYARRNGFSGDSQERTTVAHYATRGLGRTKGGSPGLGNAVQPDLGAQLSRRVSSGAIDQPQAEQVARDRALLERVYGPNWRAKVFGNARGARGLGWGTSGSKQQMINSLRNEALKRARAKNAG